MTDEQTPQEEQPSEGEGQPAEETRVEREMVEVEETRTVEQPADGGE